MTIRSALSQIATVLTFVVVCVSALEGFNAEDNLPAAIDDFQRWFEQHYKGKVKVRLGEAGDGMRIGVFALEKLPAESKYLSIPISMIIGEETIFPTPIIGPALQKLQRVFPMDRHQATLALFLIYERFIAGNKSFFAPYIRLIPTEHDIPEAYSKSELDELKGTLIPEKVKFQREQHQRDFNNMRQQIFAKDRDTFPPHTFNYQHWQWAMGILNTRMIWWDNAPHLVPMLDMINCRQGPTNPYRVHSTRRSGDRADTLAPWTFNEGDQVFENYGQPNPTYFLYHGFVMEPNVHDCAQTRFLPDRVSQRHVRKLHELRLWREEYCVTSSKYAEMLTAARVIAAADTELSDMTAAPGSRVSIHNERRALKLMGDSIRTQLESMVPFVEGWRENLATASFRTRMITTFRETQRKMLNDTLNALRAAAKRVPKDKPLPRQRPSSGGEL